MPCLQIRVRGKKRKNSFLPENKEKTLEVLFAIRARETLPLQRNTTGRQQGLSQSGSNLWIKVRGSMNALNKVCEVIKPQVHSPLALAFTVLQCPASLWEAPGHVPSEVRPEDLDPLLYLFISFSLLSGFILFLRKPFLQKCLRFTTESRGRGWEGVSTTIFTFSCLNTAGGLGVAAHIFRYQVQSPSSDYPSRTWSSRGACHWNWNNSLLIQFGGFDSRVSTETELIDLGFFEP